MPDADFRTWWATHQVTGTGYDTKHYRHPLVGDLTLDCDTWDSGPQVPGPAGRAGLPGPPGNHLVGNYYLRRRWRACQLTGWL